MRRQLTKDQYERANEAVRRRRFREMRLRGSRVGLAGPVPGLTYWFERNDVAQDGATGDYWRDTNQAVISLVVDGKTSVLFYLVGTSIDSCTFTYDLYPRQLAFAVVAMRRSKLGRFIRPAAEWALRELPASRRPVLQSALEALLQAKGSRASKARAGKQGKRSAYDRVLRRVTDVPPEEGDALPSKGMKRTKHG